MIKLPDSVGHGLARAFARLHAERDRGRSRPRPRGRRPRTRSSRPIAVPVMGRIAAGTPIEAIQTRSHVINIPPDLLSAGEHFALEVRGDSMIEAGILDGDIALIRRTEAADTGDIVVALIDDEEATLEALPPPRRLDRAGTGQYRLRGAHPSAQPRAHPGQACRGCSDGIDRHRSGIRSRFHRNNRRGVLDVTSRHDGAAIPLLQICCAAWHRAALPVDVRL